MAPTTTSAPTTTAAPTTTSPPTTTMAPTTTNAPTTPAASITSASTTSEALSITMHPTSINALSTSAPTTTDFQTATSVPTTTNAQTAVAPTSPEATPASASSTTEGPSTTNNHTIIVAPIGTSATTTTNVPATTTSNPSATTVSASTSTLKTTEARSTTSASTITDTPTTNAATATNTPPSTEGKPTSTTEAPIISAPATSVAPTTSTQASTINSPASSTKAATEIPVVTNSTTAAASVTAGTILPAFSTTSAVLTTISQPATNIVLPPIFPTFPGTVTTTKATSVNTGTNTSVSSTTSAVATATTQPATGSAAPMSEAATFTGTVTTTAAPSTVVGPVFIFVRLVFHTNNTVPSESDVLAKGSPFVNGDEIQLNDTVRVQNLTYERLSDNSFALTLAYKINDLSFPENVKLRTETQVRIQDSVNNLPLAQRDSCQCGVCLREGDINQPSKFLAAILAVSVCSLFLHFMFATTASPAIATTSSPAVTTTAAHITVVGPVFIFVRLVFRTNNTIPSESDVLAKGSPFLNGDEIQLNDTVRVQNLTYERLTDNSFALRLAYKINDVSFPENVELRTETQARIQDSVNKLMNGLLIQPNASPFTFPQANFTHLPNEIRANVEYVYQEGDINQPSNFLAAILAVSGLATTTASPVISTSSPALPTTAAPRTVVGPVFIFVRLVFHTNNTVPSESDVLAKGSPFLNGDEIRLNDTVRVQNLTYERLSDNSFALSLAYKINDVTFPENVELRTETQARIQDSVNKLMNGLLIQPNASPFTFPQANFTHLPNEIRANVEYVYQEGDINQPSNFLAAILAVSGPAPTTASPVIPTTPSAVAPTTSRPATHIVPPITAAPTVRGMVFIFLRFVFHTLKPVPTESQVLSQVSALLKFRQTRALDNPVRIQDLTYEKISDHIFALKLNYQISNVTFPEKYDLRNETQKLIQDSANKLLNTLLNSPNANPFTFPEGNYTHLPNEIHANVEYVFREGDINQPSNFLAAILAVSGLATTTASPVVPTTTSAVAPTISQPATESVPPIPVAPTSGGTVTTTEAPRIVYGTIFIVLRFVFHTLKPVPTESQVLSHVSALLNGREIKELGNPVRIEDLTYEKITDHAFALQLSYRISNVSFPEKYNLRNETQKLIQDSANKLLNGLLNSPNANPFTFPEGNYTNLPQEIHANVEYVFREGDINLPSDFLAAILAVSGPTTTTASPVIATTNFPASTTTSDVAPMISEPATESVTPILEAPTSGGAVTTTEAIRMVRGTVFIFLRFVFHTLKPIPTEIQVLSRVSVFLRSRQSRALDNPVRIQDLTYEKISDHTFTLKLSYRISNVTFPEKYNLRNETQQLIQISANDLLNGLLNSPNAIQFTFPEGNYTHLPNEIHANVEYLYQKGDINQPSNFLAAILAVSGPTTTTASPVIATTNSPAVTTTAAPRTVVGPVFIFVRLVFHTNNTVPSESDVLAKGSPFLNGDEIRLNDTVRVQNLTYERLTDHSFALSLAYKINDVSFPENVELRTKTQGRIQDAVNKLMNGLLIQPDASPFTFPQAKFTHLPNEIHANVEYLYQKGDINQPSNFLAAILAVSGPTTTTASPVIATTNSPAVTTTAAPRTVVGPVFIFVRLVFHTNNTVPSESDVLAKGSPFLNGDEIRLNDTVRVQNLTYERLSDNSFALRLAYKINDVSFPENVELRTETQARIQDSVNKLMNGLLIKPNASPFTFPQANFTHLPNEIRANVEYVYQEGDINQPSNFLAAILAVSGPTITTASPVIATTNFPVSTTTSAVAPTISQPATQRVTPIPGAPTTTEAIRMVRGTVFIIFRFMFYTLKPVPTKSQVLSRVSVFLRSSELRLMENPVRIADLEYEKITDHAYALLLHYQISNMSFPEKFSLRNTTQQLIQASANDLLNRLLNSPNEKPFTFPEGNYTNGLNVINASVEYVFREGDINQPSSFLAAILEVSGLATTTSSPVMSTTTSAVAPTISQPATQSVTPIPGAPTTTEAIRMVRGTVFIILRFVFHTLKPVPTESQVLSRVSVFLKGRELRLMENPVRIADLEYEKISDHIFALKLNYQISNVTFPEKYDLRNETQKLIQDSANKLLNLMLNQPGANPFIFPQANYTNMPNQINANVEYVFRQGDINQPSPFLTAVLNASGLAPTTAPTTTEPLTTTAVQTTGEPTTTTAPTAATITQTISGMMTPTAFQTSTSPHGTMGSVFICIRLVFDTVKTVPSESEIVTMAQTLLDARLWQMNDTVKAPSNMTDLNDPVRVQNITYQQLSDHSFDMTLGYRINDVHIPENPELRNETYKLIQDAIDKLLNLMLIQPKENPFHFPQAIFTITPNQINATVEYVYQKGDINEPSKFLTAVLNASGLAPTTAPTTPEFPAASAAPTTGAPTTTVAPSSATVAPTFSGMMTSITSPNSTSPSSIIGNVFIFIQLVFHTIMPVPSEREILTLADKHFDARLRQPTVHLRTLISVKQLNDPVSVQNITYQKLSDHSFAVRLGYKIPDVSMPENVQQRNNTYKLIQDSINQLLNIMLTKPDANPFNFRQANYTDMPNQINASVEYVFQPDDIKQPSEFLIEILKVSGLAPTAPPPTAPTAAALPPAPVTTSTTAGPTTTSSHVLLLITSTAGRFPGWALAIIIPCGIAIILLPFWILLCCQLCGFCAAIKRWHRRRPYHMQAYQPHSF
ncbi:mucin-5AC-like [Anguilla rostrata]|uniref:mucin-5AC-like n=1 Tax=Anguilla rostrata TaxID=7938 RepID=UPI0030CC265C